MIRMMFSVRLVTGRTDSIRSARILANPAKMFAVTNATAKTDRTDSPMFALAIKAVGIFENSRAA